MHRGAARNLLGLGSGLMTLANYPTNDFTKENEQEKWLQTPPMFRPRRVRRRPTERILEPEPQSTSRLHRQRYNCTARTACTYEIDDTDIFILIPSSNTWIVSYEARSWRTPTRASLLLCLVAQPTW